MSHLVAVQAELARLWRGSRPLTIAALAMLPVLLFSVLGLLLDPRLVGGAPVWLKPGKFALSIAIYSLTLAWLFRYLPAHRRTRVIVGHLSAAVMLFEMGIIIVQAARGRASHFNVGTPLDALLFNLMGSAIVLQTLASVAVAVALWRQQFADRALGWALRLGMVLTIVGASLGGIMASPRPEQIALLQAGQPTPLGAHTVGAPDGGPGLPGIGWSREHGDLRAAHFMGLHALQALSLVALATRRLRRSNAHGSKSHDAKPHATEARRTTLIFIAAGSYASLLGILLWQALRGRALLALDHATAIALVTWFTLVLGATVPVLIRRRVRHGTELSLPDKSPSWLS